MSDSISVTTHNSYGSRLGNSFKSILWWIVLIIISIVILAWNENNYVKQKSALKEWASIVQETSSDQINPELEWKEIHLYWTTASDDEQLQDNIFGISTNDLKLKRTVEMYQWYEESSETCSDNLWWSQDCTTEYSYHKKWSDEHISSNNFYQSSTHENPSDWEFESNERIKEPITLWAYTLTDVFVNQLTDYKTIDLSDQNFAISQNEKFHINGDQIYIWTDPNQPAIWDLRITFSSIKPYTVSIVWKQLWNELTSYTVSNGRSIALLEAWNVSAEDMFLHAQKANQMMTWIIRLVWLLLMFCGFSALFRFIEILAKVIPFLSNIIGVWTSIIALWLTLIVWFITIWVAWLAVRPIIGISCLAVASGWMYLLMKSKKSKNNEQVEITNTNM